MNTGQRARDSRCEGEPVAEIVPNTQPLLSSRSELFSVRELTEFDFDRSR
jgi:hypothetical protein